MRMCVYIIMYILETATKLNIMATRKKVLGATGIELIFSNYDPSWELWLLKIRGLLKEKNERD